MKTETVWLLAEMTYASIIFYFCKIEEVNNNLVNFSAFFFINYDYKEKNKYGYRSKK